MAFLVTGVVGSVVIVVLAAFAKDARYHLAPLFLVPLLWAGYFLRRRLHVLPLHYVFFLVAILLHELGAFGYYQKSPLPFSYDIAVHYWFGFVGTLVFERALRLSFPVLKTWHTRVAAGLFVMGIGAIHEIVEYMSYLMFKEKGMMHPDVMYFFDTQRDLTDNLAGAITALTLITIFAWWRRRNDATAFNVLSPHAADHGSTGQSSVRNGDAGRPAPL
jgi:uncharacterized membrane protein YjdF